MAASGTFTSPGWSIPRRAARIVRGQASSLALTAAWYGRRIFRLDVRPVLQHHARQNHQAGHRGGEDGGEGLHCREVVVSDEW